MVFQGIATNKIQQNKRGGEGEQRGRTKGGPAEFSEGQTPISAPSPSAPMAMAAFLTQPTAASGM
jgi:hypothetical protein